jgi:hypothetical protein
MAEVDLANFKHRNASSDLPPTNQIKYIAIRRRHGNLA